MKTNEKFKVCKKKAKIFLEGRDTMIVDLPKSLTKKLKKRLTEENPNKVPLYMGKNWMLFQLNKKDNIELISEDEKCAVSEEEQEEKKKEICIKLDKFDEGIMRIPFSNLIQNCLFEYEDSIFIALSMGKGRFRTICISSNNKELEGKSLNQILLKDGRKIEKEKLIILILKFI